MKCITEEEMESMVAKEVLRIRNGIKGLPSGPPIPYLKRMEKEIRWKIEDTYIIKPTVECSKIEEMTETVEDKTPTANTAKDSDVEVVPEEVHWIWTVVGLSTIVAVLSVLIYCLWSISLLVAICSGGIIFLLDTCCDKGGVIEVISVVLKFLCLCFFLDTLPNSVSGLIIGIPFLLIAGVWVKLVCVEGKGSHY
jgi:hypothetical protein